MRIIKDMTIEINNKTFPARIHIGDKPKYIFVTNHGLLSNKTSWRYFEKWIGEDAIVVNFDSRQNGENNMRASRMSSTYSRDLRDVIRWTKKEYPNIKVVPLGSSWGTSVVLQYMKKYSDEVYRAVAWSIPYNWLGSEDSHNERENQKNENKDSGIKQTSVFGHVWRMMLMIFTNINTKSYTKVDIGKTANNKLLKRLNRINKPKKTPEKLFYSVFKAIAFSNKNMIKVNFKNKDKKFLYIQSTKDSYLTQKNLEFLKSIKQSGVQIKFIDEGKHALQWEIENNLNTRVFKYVVGWLEDKDNIKI